MFRIAGTLSVAWLCLAGALAESNAQDCPFKPWRTFKGTEIYHHKTLGAYTYVTEHKAVDADGAPNAYHPDDVGKNCRKDPHIGLDCPANAGYPKTNWWNQVLVPDPKDPKKPYVQSNGEYAGFFVISNPTISVAKYTSSNVS